MRGFNVHLNLVVKLSTDELLSAIGNLIYLFSRKDVFTLAHPFYKRFCEFASYESDELAPYLTRKHLEEGLKVLCLPLGTGPDWEVSTDTLKLLLEGFLLYPEEEVLEASAFDEYYDEVEAYLTNLIPTLQPLLDTLDVLGEPGQPPTSVVAMQATLEAHGYKSVQSDFPLVRPGSVVLYKDTGKNSFLHGLTLVVHSMRRGAFLPHPEDLILDVRQTDENNHLLPRAYRVNLSEVTVKQY